MPVQATAYPSIAARGNGGMFRSAAISLARTSPPASGGGRSWIFAGRGRARRLSRRSLRGKRTRGKPPAKWGQNIIYATGTLESSSPVPHSRNPLRRGGGKDQPLSKRTFRRRQELVPDGPECIEPGFLRAGDARRIGESPVDTVRLPEEGGADLLGAEGDHGVDGPGVDGIQPLGSVTGDVDADFVEDPDRLRADGRGERSGRRYLHPLRGERTGDPFGHLAAGRVRDAKEQDVPRPHRAEFRGLGPPVPGPGTHRFAAGRRRAGRVMFRSQIAIGPDRPRRGRPLPVFRDDGIVVQPTPEVSQHPGGIGGVACRGSASSEPISGPAGP